MISNNIVNFKNNDKSNNLKHLKKIRKTLLNILIEVCLIILKDNK